jgi:hypothetical protein
MYNISIFLPLNVIFYYALHNGSLSFFTMLSKLFLPLHDLPSFPCNGLALQAYERPSSDIFSWVPAPPPPLPPPLLPICGLLGCWYTAGACMARCTGCNTWIFTRLFTTNVPGIFYLFWTHFCDPLYTCIRIPVYRKEMDTNMSYFSAGKIFV